MWRAKIPSGFEEKFLFTKIECLRESVPFRNPSSNFPREISSHWHWMHATHILYSLSLGGNIQKVFRVFKVTWYCCSTSELSWGKGCLRGFSHRSYIGIRKDYWRKVKNIKIQEKCQWAYFIVFAQSFIKTKIICFISSPWVSRNIERKVFLFSRGIRQTENDPLRQRERDSILLSDVPGNIYKSSDPTWEDGSGLNDRNIVQSWGKSASKAWRKGMRKYEPALILHPWGWKHVKTEAVCLIFWSTYL